MLVFDPVQPNLSCRSFHKADWSEFYEETEEIITKNQLNLEKRV